MRKKIRKRKRRNKYSAEDVSKIMQSEGYLDITKRTVNYYAFDKNMFEVTESGKKCFTDVEVDKIRAIKMLREFSNMTLSQIKEIIKKHSLEEVNDMCTNRAMTMGSYYNSDPSFCDNDSLETAGLSLQSAKSFQQPLSFSEEKQEQRGKKAIKVNDNIVLLFNKNYNSEKVSKIVNFIQNLEQKT